MVQSRSVAENSVFDYDSLRVKIKY